MTEPATDVGSDLPHLPIDENRARLLGDRLRQVFDDVIAEPLPDSFANLLQKLD